MLYKSELIQEREDKHIGAFDMGRSAYQSGKKQKDIPNVCVEDNREAWLLGWWDAWKEHNPNWNTQCPSRWTLKEK